MSKKTFSKDLTLKWHLLSRNAGAFPFFRAVELLFYSSKCRLHAGLRMHVTFFVSLWKREKCANQFLSGSKERKVAKRRRENRGGGGERHEGEFSCDSRVKLHLRDPYSLRVHVHHESVRLLQVTCITISKSRSEGEPVFLHIARGHNTY